MKIIYSKQEINSILALTKDVSKLVKDNKDFVCSANSSIEETTGKINKLTIDDLVKSNEYIHYTKMGNIVFEFSEEYLLKITNGLYPVIKKNFGLIVSAVNIIKSIKGFFSILKSQVPSLVKDLKNLFNEGEC